MKKFTEEDVEIFVLTFNRAEMLKDALTSLLNQTKKVKITVIDNASEDSTPILMSEFIKTHENISYIRNEINQGSEYSYSLAGNLASKEFFMCFHDDDLLHPQYLETVIQYLNTYTNINILSTVCHTPKEMSNTNWEPISTKAIFCKDEIELASYLYYESEFAYPATVYRASAYKESNFSKKPYGKIDDKIRCLEICKGGAAIILQDKNFLRYRVHSGQDSNLASTGPFTIEIINFDIYFRKMLLSKFSIQNYLVYYVRNIEWLSFLHTMGKNKETLQTMIFQGLQKGAFCYFSYLCVKSPFKLLFAPFRKTLKKLLKINRECVDISTCLSRD